MIGLPQGEKNCDDMLSRFHLIPEYYWQTDGQTDGQTDRRTDLLYQYRASVWWRAINQRFLDIPWAYSSQILHAGVLWFRMCLLPFWGLAVPGGRKRGKWNFFTMEVNWEFLHFFRFLSDILATRGRIYSKFYLCRDNVCRRAFSPPCGVRRPLQAGAGQQS